MSFDRGSLLPCHRRKGLSVIDVQSRGDGTINVYISSTSTERRLDIRKWDREVQTGCISGTFRAFQDKAFGQGGKPDAIYSDIKIPMFSLLLLKERVREELSPPHDQGKSCSRLRIRHFHNI